MPVVVVVSLPVPANERSVSRGAGIAGYKFIAEAGWYRVKDEFTQGFVAACAITLRNHGNDTEVRDTLVCLGPEACSVVELRRLGVDDYDIDILRPVIRDLQARKRRENTINKIVR